MQEIATIPQDAASLHGHVPGDLLHPRLVRANGDPGDVHPAALKMAGTQISGAQFKPPSPPPTAAPQRGHAPGWQARQNALPQEGQGAWPAGATKCSLSSHMKRTAH